MDAEQLREWASMLESTAREMNQVADMMDRMGQGAWVDNEEIERLVAGYAANVSPAAVVPSTPPKEVVPVEVSSGLRPTTTFYMLLGIDEVKLREDVIQAAARGKGVVRLVFDDGSGRPDEHYRLV